MIWQTPKQVADDLGLPTDDDSPEAVRKALILRMAEAHPDSNGGKTDDALWQQLSSAKEFLERYREDSRALIPISQLPALIQALSAASRSADQSPAERMRDSTHIDIRGSVLLPRIGSGVFATICAFLFTFPRSVKDNPVLGELLSTSLGENVLLGSLCCSAFIFILTWIAERSRETRVELLMTEAGIEESLSRLYHTARPGNVRFTFTSRDLVTLHSHFRRRGALPSFSLPYTVAEKVARGQIGILLQQDLIREVPRTGFSRSYEVIGDAISSLPNWV